MKFETELKIHCIMFYGGLISLLIWIISSVIIMLFFSPVTDTVLSIMFLLWGMISASFVIIEADNFGAGYSRNFP